MKATLAHANMDVPLPAAPQMFQFGDMAFATGALQSAGFHNISYEEIPIVYHGDSPVDVCAGSSDCRPGHGGIPAAGA